MAIQILTQPADISWSRNPLLYEFYTDKLIQDTGRPVIFELDFTDVENIADVLVSDVEESWARYSDWKFMLSVGSTVIFIACQYNNDLSKLMIPHRNVDKEGNPLETKTEWLFRVRTTMNGNFNLESMFDILVEDDKMIFTSRKKDDNLAVKIENEVPTLPVHLSVVQVSVSAIYTPNLKIFVELFVYSDAISDNGALISAALVPDTSGIARWDLSNPITSACLADGTLLPDNHQANDVIGYFVQVTEMYGEPQAIRQTIKGGLKTAVFGGLPKNMLQLSLMDSLTINGLTRFFVTSLEAKRVTADQPNWLSWLNIGDNLVNVKVNIELTYNDGTIVPFTSKTFDTLYKHQKVVFPIGLDQIGANNLYPELSVVSYSVVLKADGEPLSPAAAYIVDDRPFTYKRFFLFKNSLGAHETFHTYGRKSIMYEISKTNASLLPSLNFVLEKGGDFDFDISLQEKEKINTGWKSKDEIKAMRDFFLSTEKFTLVNGRWWPISVTSNTIEEFQDGNGLYALTFEISIQHTQEMFFDN